MDILDIIVAKKKALALSVANNQGSENEGKFLGISGTGEVIPIEGDPTSATAGDIPYSDESTYSSGTVGAEVAQLKSNYTDLDSDVDDLKDAVGGMYPVQSASGGIINIKNGAAAPANSVVVTLPYSAGGYKKTGLRVCRKNILAMGPLYNGIGYNPSVGATKTLELDSTASITDNHNGTFTFTVPSGWYGRDILTPVKAGVKYKPNIAITGTNLRLSWGCIAFDGEVLTVSNSTNASTAINYAFEPTEDCWWYLHLASSSSGSVTITDPMLEVGEASSTYEAYDGTDYAIDWTSDAGTIYGGELNVTTGVLTSKYDSDGTELSPYVTYALDPVSVAVKSGTSQMWAVPGSLSASYKIDVGDQLDALVAESVVQAAEIDALQIESGTLTGWEDHTQAFAELMVNTTSAEGFMFATDSHFMAKQDSTWKEYLSEIAAYWAKLYYHSPCSFFLHGGDWFGNGEVRSSTLYKLGVLGGMFKDKFDNFAVLVGNHDTGHTSVVSDNDSTAADLTVDTLANSLLREYGRTYYRYDANTFHMYCFDSRDSAAIDAYTKEQIAWFGTSLLSETAAHIVIAIHILHDSGSLKAFGEQLTLCAKAYNSRGTYTYDGASYDFTGATGKVAFVIAGHTHADATGTENDIPYIETTNCTTYSNTSFANLPLPLDLIKVDWTNATLTAYRASRGSDGTTRTLSIIA